MKGAILCMHITYSTLQKSFHQVHKPSQTIHDTFANSLRIVYEHVVNGYK